MFKPLCSLAVSALMPCIAVAGPFAEASADIVLLGEVHDNPAHHQAQAEAIEDLAPTAVVFEMLTPEQASRFDPVLVGDPEALEAALGWEDAGWPDFAMYLPIFEALDGAQVVGAAVPRDAARAAFETGIPESFGAEADRFGLTGSLPEAELAARLELQDAAHCGKMPAEMLPMMIDLQRLRDATLARATLDVLSQTGGPVAVITGNGHARADWGVPAYIGRVAPEVSVLALGQSEEGQRPDGLFDMVLDAPAVDREDPCLAFE